MGVRITNWVNGEAVTETRHVGAVVGSGSMYLGDCDSNYWVVYFDFESGEFKTENTGYTPGSFEVDAPAEVQEAYEALKAAEKALGQAKAKAMRISREWYDAKVEAATPRKGKTVEVVSGRKIPVGTVGEVFWYGETQWGHRVGLKVDGETLWTAAHNVKVVEPALVDA